MPASISKKINALYENNLTELLKLKEPMKIIDGQIKSLRGTRINTDGFPSLYYAGLYEKKYVIREEQKEEASEEAMEDVEESNVIDEITEVTEDPAITPTENLEEEMSKDDEGDIGALQNQATEQIEEFISPSAKKYLEKERVKTRIATQFIGEGAKNSSTDRYREMYEGLQVANTGKYTSKDIIYVSSNGRRNNRVNPVVNGKLQGEYNNIDIAIKAGATIVMDTLDHINKTKNYNIGEVALAKYLESKGYNRVGETGEWKPKTKQDDSPEQLELGFSVVDFDLQEFNPVDNRTIINGSDLLNYKKVYTTSASTKILAEKYGLDISDETIDYDRILNDIAKKNKNNTFLTSNKAF